MEALRLENISKDYVLGKNRIHALSNVSLSVESGEMLAVMGPSGSGKSTLLNILGCLDSATSGDYYLGGENINGFSEKEKAALRNRKFGFVVQDFALINRYTVRKNVRLPLLYGRESSRSQKERVNALLERVGLSSKADIRPPFLSGGQKQRVAIARALVNDADILLCDEPTGALDSGTSAGIMHLFTELNRQGKTLIIITHDANVASYCERIITICDGRLC